MSKPREPLQVSPKFKAKIKDIQLQKMKKGLDRSLRDLTEDIINDPLFKEIEKKIIDNDIKFDIRVKLDRRFM